MTNKKTIIDVPCSTPTTIFFEEYQIWVLNNLEEASKQIKHWDSASPKEISKMPVEKQITFADYVTKNICSMTKDIILSSAIDLLRQIKLNGHMMESCAYGSSVLTITTLEKFPDQKDLCNELRKELALTIK